MNTRDDAFRKEGKETVYQKEMEKNYTGAKELLKDEDKMEQFLQKLEKKLKKIPHAGEKLSKVPVLISLVRSYMKKEYTDLPKGTIIAIVSALMYFVSPVDIIPDSIPLIGYMDDAAIIATCWELVEKDVEAYQAWRTANK